MVGVGLGVLVGVGSIIGQIISSTIVPTELVE